MRLGFYHSVVCRGLNIFALVVAITCGAALKDVAAAQGYCAFKESSNTGTLSFEDDSAIRNLILRFFEPFDSLSATDSARNQWYSSIFPSKLRYEVCTGGGNNQIFLAQTIDDLQKEMNQNHAQLVAQVIQPTRFITINQLIRVDATTVQEKSVMLLMLQTADTVHPPVQDYTASVRSTLKKDEKGWHFEDRYILIDRPSVISYGR